MKGEDRRSDRTIVDVAVRKCGHGPDSAGQHAGEFLIDVVLGGAELAHFGAVDKIEVGIFSGADGELPGLSSGIFLAQQKSAAGAEVDVTVVLALLVVHFE